MYLCVKYLNKVKEAITLCIEGSYSDLTTVIQKVHTEELSLTSGLAPCSDASLLSDTSTDTPSDSLNPLLNKYSSQKLGAWGKI